MAVYFRFRPTFLFLGAFTLLCSANTVDDFKHDHFDVTNTYGLSRGGSENIVINHRSVTIPTAEDFWFETIAVDNHCSYASDKSLVIDYASDTHGHVLVEFRQRLTPDCLGTLYDSYFQKITVLKGKHNLAINMHDFIDANLELGAAIVFYGPLKLYQIQLLGPGEKEHHLKHGHHHHHKHSSRRRRIVQVFRVDNTPGPTEEHILLVDDFSRIAVTENNLGFWRFSFHTSFLSHALVLSSDKEFVLENFTNFLNCVDMHGKIIRITYSALLSGNRRIVLHYKRRFCEDSCIDKVHFDVGFLAGQNLIIDIPVDVPFGGGVEVRGPMTIHGIQIVTLNNNMEAILEHPRLFPPISLARPALKDIDLKYDHFASNPLPPLTIDDFKIHTEFQKNNIGHYRGTSTPDHSKFIFDHAILETEDSSWTEHLVSKKGQYYDMEHKAFKVTYSATKSQNRTVTFLQTLRHRLHKHEIIEYPRKFCFHRGVNRQIIIPSYIFEWGNPDFRSDWGFGLTINGPLILHQIDVLGSAATITSPEEQMEAIHRIIADLSAQPLRRPTSSLNIVSNDEESSHVQPQREDKRLESSRLGGGSSSQLSGVDSVSSSRYSSVDGNESPLASFRHDGKQSKLSKFEEGSSDHHTSAESVSFGHHSSTDTEYPHRSAQGTMHRMFHYPRLHGYHD